MAELECPSCGAVFSWEEGSPSLLGQFSQEAADDGPGEED